MIEIDEGAPRRALTIDAVSFFMQVALMVGFPRTPPGEHDLVWSVEPSERSRLLRVVVCSTERPCYDPHLEG
jgi:hypothetical protein